MSKNSIIVRRPIFVCITLSIHPVNSIVKKHETGHEKTYLTAAYANNNGADQPAHPHSLISTFDLRCLDSIIPMLVISNVSRLYIAFVAGLI